MPECVDAAAERTLELLEVAVDRPDRGELSADRGDEVRTVTKNARTLEFVNPGFEAG